MRPLLKTTSVFLLASLAACEPGDESFGEAEESLTAGALSTGAVTPTTGTENHLYKFYVTFKDASGPTSVRVNIDGVFFPMTTTDTTPADGSKYTYSTKLTIKADPWDLSDCHHNFYFEAVAADGTTVRYPATGVKNGPVMGPPITDIWPSTSNPADGAEVPNNTLRVRAAIAPENMCGAYTRKMYYRINGGAWKYRTASFGYTPYDQGFPSVTGTLYSGYDRSSWDINPGDVVEYYFYVTQYDGTLKKFYLPEGAPNAFYRFTVSGGGLYDGVAFNGQEEQNALEILNTAAWSQVIDITTTAKSLAYMVRTEFAPWGTLNAYSDCGAGGMCNGVLSGLSCSIGADTMRALLTRARVWAPGSGRGSDTIDFVAANAAAYHASEVIFDDVVLVSKSGDCALFQDPDGTRTFPVCPASTFSNWAEGSHLRLRGRVDYDSITAESTLLIGGYPGAEGSSCAFIENWGPAVP